MIPDISNIAIYRDMVATRRPDPGNGRTVTEDHIAYRGDRHRGGGRPGRGKRALAHGTLRLIVLSLVSDGPRHGYDLIKEIDRRFGGAYSPSPGVIYPTLAWLEEMGFVALARDDAGRKTARITPAGTAWLDANRAGIDAIWSNAKRTYRTDAPPGIVAAMDDLKAALRQRFSARHDPAEAAAVAERIGQLARTIALADEPAATAEPVTDRDAGPGDGSDTAAPPDQIVTRHKLAPRRRALQVQSKTYLTPRMIRIVLEGDEARDFASPGFDDHVKLFLPGADGTPVMRDFTPRSFDTGKGTLTLDFAVHDRGPAIDWAKAAVPGDSLSVGGPRGSSVIAPVFDWWLLVGDETALPAIGRRVETLPAGVAAVTLVAVANSAEEQRFETRARLEQHWVHRPAQDAASSEPLLAAVRALHLPTGRGFVWIAAEAAVAQALKTHFISDRGHPAEWVKAAGYWVQEPAAVSPGTLD